MSDNTSLLAPDSSPLSEADAGSINELVQQRIDDIFNKPPLLLTDADLRFQVEYYQRERIRFMQESAVKEQRPKIKRKVPTSIADAIASSTDLL